MDYAAGGSLGQLVAGRGKLGPGETVTVLTPIAQALAYLHGQGFTHGDVSPGNVLFTAHGKPLLADLGVARMVADAAAVSDAGTEGFRDPAPVDAVRAGLQPERDVYSLAALGWYCLTGRAPEPGAQRPPLPLLVPEFRRRSPQRWNPGFRRTAGCGPPPPSWRPPFTAAPWPQPVDLSVSVHPTVIPQLLTRRSPPRYGPGAAGRTAPGLAAPFPQAPRAWAASAGRAARNRASLPERQRAPRRPPDARGDFAGLHSGALGAARRTSADRRGDSSRSRRPCCCWAPSLRRGGSPVRRCLRHSLASPSQAPMRRRSPR